MLFTSLDWNYSNRGEGMNWNSHIVTEFMSSRLCSRVRFWRSLPPLLPVFGAHPSIMGMGMNHCGTMVSGLSQDRET